MSGRKVIWKKETFLSWKLIKKKKKNSKTVLFGSLKSGIEVGNSRSGRKITAAVSRVGVDNPSPADGSVCSVCMAFVALATAAGHIYNYIMDYKIIGQAVM